MTMPSNQYPTRQLGANGPMVSAQGFGAMNTTTVGAFYGKTNDEEAFQTLTSAANRGVTFWDTSDMYGASEAFLGNWFSSTGRRHEIFLATKWGAGSAYSEGSEMYIPCSKPSYIHKRIAYSLEQLKTDHIDLYYQHRVDKTVPIEIVMETLRPYVEKGTIRYVGLSEAPIEVVKRAKAVPEIGEKLIAVQMEFNPFVIELEQNGYINACKEMGITVVAYSPLGKGLLTGQIKSPDDLAEEDMRKMWPIFQKENFYKLADLIEQFKKTAAKHGAMPGQVALAWILASHTNVIPLPGTRTPTRLEENANAVNITLDEEDMKDLRKYIDEVAALNLPRYAAAFESAMSRNNCLPLSEWKGE